MCNILLGVRHMSTQTDRWLHGCLPFMAEEDPLLSLLSALLRDSGERPYWSWKPSPSPFMSTSQYNEGLVRSAAVQGGPGPWDPHRLCCYDNCRRSHLCSCVTLGAVYSGVPWLSLVREMDEDERRFCSVHFRKTLHLNRKKYASFFVCDQSVLMSTRADGELFTDKPKLDTFLFSTFFTKPRLKESFWSGERGLSVKELLERVKLPLARFKFAGCWQEFWSWSIMSVHPAPTARPRGEGSQSCSSSSCLMTLSWMTRRPCVNQKQS